jgi:hypothetical protein
VREVSPRRGGKTARAHDPPRNPPSPGARSQALLRAPGPRDAARHPSGHALDRSAVGVRRYRRQGLDESRPPRPAGVLRRLVGDVFLGRSGAIRFVRANVSHGVERPAPDLPSTRAAVRAAAQTAARRVRSLAAGRTDVALQHRSRDDDRRGKRFAPASRRRHRDLRLVLRGDGLSRLAPDADAARRGSKSSLPQPRSAPKRASPIFRQI